MNDINSKFNEALKDVNNKNIIMSIALNFRKKMNKFELEQLAYIGLWKALLKYDSAKGMKFTTYLYKITRWVFIKHTRKQKLLLEKNNFIKQEYDLKKKYLVNNNRNYILIKDLLLSLDEKDKEIIEDRFLSNLSIQKISDKNSINMSQTKSRISKILKKMRLNIE